MATSHRLVCAVLAACAAVACAVGVAWLPRVGSVAWCQYTRGWLGGCFAAHANPAAEQASQRRRQAASASAFSVAMEGLSTARAGAPQLVYYNDIVSLGPTCTVAYNLKQQDLRLARYPFDWTLHDASDLHPLSTLAGLVRTNFSSLLDPTQLAYVQWPAPPGFAPVQRHDKHNKPATPVCKQPLRTHVMRLSKVGRVADARMEPPSVWAVRHREAGLVWLHDDPIAEVTAKAERAEAGCPVSQPVTAARNGAFLHQPKSGRCSQAVHDLRVVLASPSRRHVLFVYAAGPRAGHDAAALLRGVADFETAVHEVHPHLTFSVLLVLEGDAGRKAKQSQRWRQLQRCLGRAPYSGDRIQAEAGQGVSGRRMRPRPDALRYTTARQGVGGVEDEELCEMVAARTLLFPLDTHAPPVSSVATAGEAKRHWAGDAWAWKRVMVHFARAYDRRKR